VRIYQDKVRWGQTLRLTVDGSNGFITVVRVQ
jgi:hypothetical protein